MKPKRIVRRRIVRRLIVPVMLGLAASPVAAPVFAQQMLNLRDADIRAFIQDVSRVTGRTFIIDPRVNGKVSVVTDRPLSRTEYFEVFLSTLRANGLVAVPATGGAFRVQPVEGSAAAAGRVGGRAAGNNSFATEVFRLRTIDSQSALDAVRPLVGTGGSVTASRSGNSIVVADYADNIRRIRAVIARIDRDATDTRVVPLRNSSARELAQSLTQLVGGGVAGAAAPATIVAMEGANALALRGDPGTVSRIARIAEDLDRRAEHGTEIKVIFLEHADAEKLVPVLQTLVGQAVVNSPTQGRGLSGSGLSALTAGGLTGPSSGNVTSLGGNGNSGGGLTGAGTSTAPIGGSSGAAPVAQAVARGEPVIARYEGANAIIISAPADLQRTLGEVIRQLDSRREQVLVEAIIVEISDSAAKTLGVQFLLAGKNVPFLATNYSNAAPNLATLGAAYGARQLATTTTTINGNTVVTGTDNTLSNQLGQAAINSVLGASGVFGGYAAKLGSTLFASIINAVRSDTKSNLLSTPSIVTLDNQEAKILVGQEIPITTGQALSNNFDNAFRTVQRQNVGVSLEVKPQINAGGAINLAIRQEVSSIAGPVSSSNSELILNKRQIETVVTVDDGDIVALGGLLDDNERRTIEKVPLLGDLPGVGALFRSKSRSRAKTNLMVFIRPTIIGSAADARAVAERRYGFTRQQQLDQTPGVEPSIDELVRDYMGAKPPLPAPPLPGSEPPALGPAAPAGAPQIITPQVAPIPAQPVRPVLSPTIITPSVTTSTVPIGVLPPRPKPHPEP